MRRKDDRVRNSLGGLIRRDPNYIPSPQENIQDNTQVMNPEQVVTASQEPIINTGYRQSFEKLQNELTNVPPQPSSLVQPFSEPAQQSANQIFGDLFARQNAIGAPMMFKINK